MKADELITKSDLEQFKKEILNDISGLIKNNHIQKPWLNNADLQEILGISYSTLQNLRVNGALPYTKLGGTIYYAWDDIERVMQENKSDK